MNRFFSMDNKFFAFMAKAADLVLLNVVFLVCCLPIVTIGASCTAMYYVTLKMARNEESYIVRSFFKSFKENFKQAAVMWLIMLGVGILLHFDYNIVAHITADYRTLLLYGLLIITTIYIFILLYAFPLLSKFINTVKNTFKNALLMSIKHLPYTIFMLLVTFVPVLASLFIPAVMLYGLIVWILIGFSLIAYINSHIFVKIFDRYIPKEEEESGDEQPVSEGAGIEDPSPVLDCEQDESESNTP